ncbi:PAS domain-containing sensor histidine kinase [Thalassotalea euphylliae]|uniref:Sensor protein FixL n=1 Tax=Thalassotalea euphylliae TaxID=1655234 RepID=A0A3E0UKK9_9GAMM|nr:PAS domain-containing sensor histidine kinase [Thalassotalea euphylliae]REL37163.1 PAS domain S-box protein [Thalassotalea euphylliae]
MFNAQIQSVIDTVVDGFIIIDEKGQIQSFNAAACRIFGYQSEEVLGKNVNVLMPEPFHSEHDGYLANYLTTGTKKIIGKGREIKAQRKNGETFPMELSVNELFIDEQRYFLGTISDITSRKLGEAQLRTSVKYAETLLDTVIDGLITIDSRGQIKEFNKAAQRIFGYQKSEVVGQNVKILMPDPYHSEHDQYLQNYHHSGVKKIIGLGREVAARKKDGTIFPIELGVNEMKNEGETIFVGTIHDISERKAAESEIQTYMDQLKVSNEELDQFAYIASHDLKEPLRGLSNNAMFLEEDYEQLVDERGKQRLARMRFLCQRMEHLVDSLLYYSRLGRQELAINKVNLTDVLTNVVEITLPEEKPNISVHWPSDLPEVLCDVPRTTELFRNLISNAIKYNNSPNKRVEVGITQMINPFSGSQESRVFFVKDNGIGIDKRFFTDIFRIFKRLNEENDAVRGTGVGLTFVKKIIERQNGQIWLESSVGNGTCFYFTLNMEGNDGQ